MAGCKSGETSAAPETAPQARAEVSSAGPFLPSGHLFAGSESASQKGRLVALAEEELTPKRDQYGVFLKGGGERKPRDKISERVVLSHQTS